MKTKEIVINVCYGGFGLSDLAYEELTKLNVNARKYKIDPEDLELKYLNFKDEYRENPLLIKVVKELGKKANGDYAELKIVKIPADIEYTISDYDGVEAVEEKHKIWQ